MSLSDKVLWRTQEDDRPLARDEYWLEVDENDRLILPPEVREHYGIRAGARVLLKEGGKTLQLQRPITQLAKVYVQPTSTDEILSYTPVIAFPSLMVNGELICVGRLPMQEEILNLLKAAVKIKSNSI